MTLPCFMLPFGIGSGYGARPAGLAVRLENGMAYIAGGLVGVVWFWFWIRGHWFAALTAALATGWIPIIDDKWHTEWAICLTVLVLPWLPMLAWPVARRLIRDIKVIAGTDAEFAEPLSLQLRD